MRQRKRDIEKDIYHARRGKGNKRGAGLADAAEDGRLEIVKQYDRHADKVYPKVYHGLRQNVIRHIERHKKRPGNKLTDDGIWLRRRAEEHVELMDKTQNEMTAGEGIISGEVSIGGAAVVDHTQCRSRAEKDPW